MIKLSNQTFRNQLSSGGAPQHLSLVQRILLGCDGTMTNLLEEIAGETLASNKLYERMTPPQERQSPSEDGRLWRRIVTLQGATTGIHYLYADSVLFPENLDSGFADQLRSTQRPIGKLWEQFRVETYKTLIEWGVDRAGASAPYFYVEPTDVVLYRTYQVLSDGKPVMKITEMFPRCWYTGVGFSLNHPDQAVRALAVNTTP